MLFMISFDVFCIFSRYILSEDKFSMAYLYCLYFRSIYLFQVIETINSVVYATQYPQDCHYGQNATNVNATGGNLVLTAESICGRIYIIFIYFNWNKYHCLIFFRLTCVYVTKCKISLIDLISI